jgi:serine/threonine protein kinase
LHRDIKPANLLLVKPEGSARDTRRSGTHGVRAHLKVADFGLVRIWESQRIAASGAGTPAYMPPEVWNGKVSRHSDQYSLAVTYAELRLGRPMFSGTSMYELMVEALTRDPNLSGLDETEQQVVRKAMDKEPDKRFGSCLEFIHELTKAVTPAAPPAPVPEGPLADTDNFGTLRPGFKTDASGSGTPGRKGWRPDTEPLLEMPPVAPSIVSRLLVVFGIVLALAVAAGLYYALIVRRSGPPYRLEAPRAWPCARARMPSLTCGWSGTASENRSG